MRTDKIKHCMQLSYLVSKSNLAFK